MEVDQQHELAEALPTYTLDVLNIVRTAQAIHGLKHSEYSRYRWDQCDCCFVYLYVVIDKTDRLFLISAGNIALAA